MGQQLFAGAGFAQQQHGAAGLCGPPRLALDFHRRRTAAHKAGEGVARLALPAARHTLVAGQLAPGIFQVALQQRELGHQRAQVGFGLVKQHNTQRTHHATVGVAQGNAADHKGTRPVGEQVDQDGFAGFQHLVHLGVLHHRRHGVAHKILLTLKAQRRQKAAVLVVDPHHPCIAVHQHHALAGIGKQVEHGAGRQLQNALGIGRQGMGSGHASMCANAARTCCADSKRMPCQPCRRAASMLCCTSSMNTVGTPAVANWRTAVSKMSALGLI